MKGVTHQLTLSGSLQKYTFTEMRCKDYTSFVEINYNQSRYIQTGNDQTVSWLPFKIVLSCIDTASVSAVILSGACFTAGSWTSFRLPSDSGNPHSGFILNLTCLNG